MSFFFSKEEKAKDSSINDTNLASSTGMSIVDFQIVNARDPVNITELYVDISIQNCSFHDTGVFGEIYSKLPENSSDVYNWEVLNNRTMELWKNGSAYSRGGAIGLDLEESPFSQKLGSPSKFAVEIVDTDFINTAAGSSFTLIPANKWYLHYGGGAVYMSITMGVFVSVVFRSVNFVNCT